MLRFALLLLLYVVAAFADVSKPPQCGFDQLIYEKAGITHSVYPDTYEPACPDNTNADYKEIRIKGADKLNFYVLFPNTNLSKKQKVSIHNINTHKKLAECEGDDDAHFCPPIILLESEFILRMPYGSQDALEVVIVSTTPIPYYYYAYYRLPAWATVTTVIATFVFLFLMTTLCCCCILMMCRHHRGERTTTTGHCRRRRHVPAGQPVYSTSNPVLFDLPPIYMVHEEGPLPEKSAPPTQSEA